MLIVYNFFDAGFFVCAQYFNLTVNDCSVNRPRPRGAGSTGVNWYLGYVEQVIFDLDPLLKNGSRAPA